MVPDDRNVRWALYEDGTLVINGENEENYNGHGEITESCDKPVWSNSWKKWEQYGLLNLDAKYDINNTNVSIGDKSFVPWNNLCDKIYHYEFASETSPTRMDTWFARQRNLLKIDKENLDTREVKSMKYLFFHYGSQDPNDSNELINSVPSFDGWDVPNLTDMSLAFGCMPSGTIGYPLLNLYWTNLRYCDFSYTFGGNPFLSLIGLPWNTSLTGSRTFFGCSKLPHYDDQKVDGTEENFSSYTTDPSLLSFLDPSNTDWMGLEDVLSFSTTPGLFDDCPSYLPVSAVMKLIDQKLVMNQQFMKALRGNAKTWYTEDSDGGVAFRDFWQDILSGFQTPYYNPPFPLDYDQIWNDLAQNPENSRSILTTLFSNLESDIEYYQSYYESDEYDRLDIELTKVEQTKYLIYVEFKINDDPVRTSLRLPQ